MQWWGCQSATCSNYFSEVQTDLYSWWYIYHFGSNAPCFHGHNWPRLRVSSVVGKWNKAYLRSNNQICDLDFIFNLSFPLSTPLSQQFTSGFIIFLKIDLLTTKSESVIFKLSDAIWKKDRGMRAPKKFEPTWSWERGQLKGPFYSPSINEPELKKGENHGADTEFSSSFIHSINIYQGSTTCQNHATCWGYSSDKAEKYPCLHELTFRVTLDTQQKLSVSISCSI